MGEGNPGTLKVEPGNHPTMNSGLRPPAQELKGIGQPGGKKWFERTLGLIYLLQCGLSGPELWKTKTLPKEMRTSEQRGPGGGAKGIRKRCPGPFISQTGMLRETCVCKGSASRASPRWGSAGDHGISQRSQGCSI